MYIFEQNPDLKEVFQTVDGELFYTDNAAKNHARTLEDKTVEHFTRPAELKIVTDDSEESEEEEPKELTLAEKVGKMTKKEIIEFAKTTFAVEVDSNLNRDAMLAIVGDLLTEKQ
jgi:hypothetical protein